MKLKLLAIMALAIFTIYSVCACVPIVYDDNDSTDFDDEGPGEDGSGPEQGDGDNNEGDGSNPEQGDGDNTEGDGSDPEQGDGNNTEGEGSDPEQGNNNRPGITLPFLPANK